MMALTNARVTRVRTRNWLSPSVFVLTFTLLQSAGCGDAGVGPEEMSTVKVTVNVSGVDKDDSFLVSLDNGANQTVSSAAPLLLRSVAGGRHTLSFTGLSDNCALLSQNPLVISASPGSVTEVNVQVTCTAASAIIAVSVPLSGVLGTIWFGVKVDEAGPSWIRGNEKTDMGAFPRGPHTVRLTEIPGWCVLHGPSSSDVSVRVDGGVTQDTIVVSFDVSCDPDHKSDNSAIVFQRGERIMLIDEDGASERMLTTGVAPSWAPDGSFIVFQRPHCQDWGCDDQVWTIRPEGYGERQITGIEGFMDSDPAVSPDGKSVTFVRFWNGPDQTYLMVGDLSGAPPVVLSIWYPFSSPAWSPDGSRIAFTCAGYTGIHICVVQRMAGCDSYFVNVCEGHLPAVVQLIDTQFSESDPAWSPDGSRIAFTLACSNGQCPPGVTESESYVAIFDSVTKAVSLLTLGSSPAWSRDGKRIVYKRNGDNPGLYVINADGTMQRRITDDSRDTNPSWR